VSNLGHRASHISGALVSWAERRGLPCDIALNGDIAIYSPCRRFRYILTRNVGAGDRVLVGMGLNPSTATAFKNDPTIKRGIGFASRWGCGLYVMLNAYGWRDTKPANLWAAERNGVDIVGEHNDAAIDTVLCALSVEDRVLAAWGGHAEPDRVARVAELMVGADAIPMCLGTNCDGSPRHLLYLPYETPLERWAQFPEVPHG
jgi:hypothetical protein